MTKKIQYFLGTLLTVTLSISVLHATVFGKEVLSFIGTAPDHNERIYRWRDDVSRVHYSDQRPFYDIPVHSLRILNVAGTQTRLSEQTHLSDTVVTKKHSFGRKIR